jgi:hypothetical protein
MTTTKRKGQNMTTSQDWERRRNRWAEYKAQQEGNAMTHDETRDNTTAIETQSIEADAHEDTRDGTNPTAVCPCGEVVEIEWDHEYNDGWNVCGVECPKCGRRSSGGNSRDATVNSWMTTRQVYQSNAAFEQMELDSELYAETGVRYG